MDPRQAELRAAFGTVLFIAWGVLSILWVYDAIYKLAHGEPEPAIAAVVALLLMLVLAVMEGLEVVMIHDWNRLYPDRTAHDLAAWLAARQMFVALIVTAAAMLAERHSIAIPFTSTEITGTVTLKTFNVIWTTLTILWFMQILPKHMAAINPDRYLKVTGGRRSRSSIWSRRSESRGLPRRPLGAFRSCSVGMPSRPSRGHRGAARTWPTPGPP